MKGGHEAARRGATRVRDTTHGFLMKSLFDGPWGATWKKHRATSCEANLFGSNTAPMEFSPPHVKNFNDFIRWCAAVVRSSVGAQHQQRTIRAPAAWQVEVGPSRTSRSIIII
jgi:hypothetical protein